MKVLFSLVILFISQYLYSQDKLSDTTHKVPFDTNKIADQTLLSNSSDVFSYDSLYIWNDKRTLSEIMDERQGFFIFDMGLGDRNALNYNNWYANQTGIFRDGIQINDNYYQGFDIQNISVSEIDRIEEVSDVSSFFYGINSMAKSVNVITKDVFQPKPFTQLRFSQDRFGSLFADVFFSQPFSRKGNVQIGITKHSIDGRYANSAFNIWRGRGRVNLYLSPKINAKLNFYLDNFTRGLNEGLVYNADPNVLSDPEIAEVINPESNEDLENYFYDLTMTGRFFKNKNSLTKFKLYSNNSNREFFETNDLGPYFSHSILYGGELTQNFNIQHTKDLNSDIFLGGNIYFNLFKGLTAANQNYSYQQDYYSLRAKYDLTYKSFFISALLRNDNIRNTNYLNSGAEARIIAYQNKDLLFELSGGLNHTGYYIENGAKANVIDLTNYNFPHNLYEVGGKIIYKNFTIEATGFKKSYDQWEKESYGVNSTISFISEYTDLVASYNYSNIGLFPVNYIKSDLAYKDILFRGKLKLKTGFNIKYYNIDYITLQNQLLYSSNYTNGAFPQTNQFIADFYVGARIGKANINLTIANIFNSLVYNTYVYPLDDRGGFLNAISRFTIVWDFIN
ncbi:MAG: TonB-dependent receptor plug domain-containing protein [Ignavibacteriae bacterium]|nr:TonB-dependent receptor plug domain-containing protein [Ignavibacteriota bacterium]